MQQIKRYGSPSKCYGEDRMAIMYHRLSLEPLFHAEKELDNLVKEH